MGWITFVAEPYFMYPSIRKPDVRKCRRRQELSLLPPFSFIAGDTSATTVTRARHLDRRHSGINFEPSVVIAASVSFSSRRQAKPRFWAARQDPRLLLTSLSCHFSVRPIHFVPSPALGRLGQAPQRSFSRRAASSVGSGGGLVSCGEDRESRLPDAPESQPRRSLTPLRGCLRF